MFDTKIIMVFQPQTTNKINLMHVENPPKGPIHVPGTQSSINDI